MTELPLKETGMPGHGVNALYYAGIRTEADLVAYMHKNGPQSLLRLPFFGRKSFNTAMQIFDKHRHSMPQSDAVAAAYQAGWNDAWEQAKAAIADLSMPSAQS